MDSYASDFFPDALDVSSSSQHRSSRHFPPELVHLILFHVHRAFVPTSSLDPFLSLDKTGSLVICHPSEAAHQIYSLLCLVDRLWYAATRPFLWSIVKIGRPASFEKLLWTIGTSDDGIQLARATRRELAISPPVSRDSSPAAPERRGRAPDDNAETYATQRRSGSLSRALFGNSVPSGPFSRGSPREASLSPGRYDNSPASLEAFEENMPFDPSNPGLLIAYLSFSRFRTHGMRRTGRESSQNRFVTSQRLLKILHGTRAPGNLLQVENDNDSSFGSEDESSDDSIWKIKGKLAALALTEYMDSALVREVLEEILLRGGVDGEYVTEKPAQAGSQAAFKDSRQICRQREGSKAALNARPIIALDLCGCVSARFIQGLKELVFAHQLSLPTVLSSSDAEAGSRVRTIFPHLRRLGLSQTLIAPELLSTFVISFPNLTHLDLTNTRASEQLLDTLGRTEGMRLECLSLARCRGLSSQSIRSFIVGRPHMGGGVCDNLTQLSLYGDRASPSPVLAEDLFALITAAPCFLSGRLRVLDLSTLPVTNELLSDHFPKQPRLLDLGLAGCHFLSYDILSQFLCVKAPKVQVLDLTGSCGARQRDVPLANIMLSLHARLLRPCGVLYPDDFKRRVCDLRVVELDEPLLDEIHGGARNWKVVWGSGRRGWYIDLRVASKPLPTNEQDFAEISSEPDESGLIPLEETDPRHLALSKLVKAHGNVSSDVGWHARKMEILFGLGMLGREEGLYGFHAYG